MNNKMLDILKDNDNFLTLEVDYGHISKSINLDSEEIYDDDYDRYKHYTLNFSIEDTPIARIELNFIDYMDSDELYDVYEELDCESQDDEAFMSDLIKSKITEQTEEPFKLCLIQTFYITPEARGLGIGSKLFAMIPKLLNGLTDNSDNIICGIEFNPFSKQLSLNSEEHFLYNYSYGKINSDIVKQFEWIATKNNFCKYGKHWFGFYWYDMHRFINLVDNNELSKGNEL